jgi:hypothetical protein
MAAGYLGPVITMSNDFVDGGDAIGKRLPSRAKNAHFDRETAGKARSPKP